MPLDRLSDDERLRLAELIKGPPVPPADPVRPPTKIQWPKWDGWSVPAVKAHFKVHWRAWVAGSAAGLASFLLLAIAVRLAGRRDVDLLKLQVRESRGQLQIRWDPQADLVRRATGAKLFISDGPERLFVTLDSQRLRRGTVSYARQTGRVELRLALAEPDGRTFEQQAVFYGAPVPEEDASQLSASALPAAASSAPAVAREVKPIEPAGVIEHRSRRKPLVQSGTELPFTCALGDVFHKTDAPAGWDTFTCKGRNVWSVAPAQAGAERSTQRPNANANTLTAKPASTSTT